MPPSRVFLGWDRPPLVAVADWCLTQAPNADFAAWLLVIPSARSKRLLQATLVERLRSSPHPAPLSPPTILTPGELGPALLPSPGVPAGASARRLAWVEAMRRTGPTILSTLFRALPSLDDTHALLGLADLFELWSREVASSGRRLAQVAETRPADLPDFSDADRWAAAGVVQDHYEAVLGERGAHDPDLALIDRVRAHIGDTVLARPTGNDAPGHPPTSPRRRVVLVGLVECPPLLQALLEHSPLPTTALVLAPDREHASFDELGCVRVDHWAQRSIDLDDHRLHAADDPRDQARVVLDRLSSLNGVFSAEEIVVGAADPEVTPHLEIAARRHATPPDSTRLEFRPSEGRPASLTPPGVLLREVREYISTRSLASMAALVRHPDLETRLRCDLAPPYEPPLPTEHWLGRLDAFASDSMADSAIGPWRGGNPDHHHLLDALRDALNALLGPLLDPATKPADAWTCDVLALLARVYANRRFQRENPVHDQTVTTCDTIVSIGHDLALAPPIPLSPSDALGLILATLERTPVPPPPARDAIEIVGWLELALDPSSVVIATGLNEGKVPSKPTVQAMLPERLRAVLGLSTSRSRLARDAYWLTLLLQTHQRVDLVVGRRSADDEPLLPSRLLFACDDTTAAHRLRRFMIDPPGASGAAPVAPSAPAGAIATPHAWGGCPVPDAAVPDSIPVTAFGLYLRSPYEFYLRHVKSAREIEEPEPELPPHAFGSLLHDVLHAFASQDAARSDDPSRVAQALTDLLSAEVHTRLGPRPRAAVSAQIDAARDRLIALAPHQARRAGEGWRILHAEFPVDPKRAFLIVDGEPISIHGRIDRIDRHEDGRVAVIDYKVGEEPDDPEQAHRAGHRGERRWIDLQLPLYRHLVAPLLWPGQEPPALAMLYARLGAEEKSIGFATALWTDDDLASADETAAEVIRAIRRCEFNLPGQYTDRRIVRALCAHPDGRPRPPRRIRPVAIVASDPPAPPTPEPAP